MNSIEPVINLINMGSGVFINLGTANVFARAITVVSPMRYATELQMRRALAGEPEWYQQNTLQFLGYDLGAFKCVMVLVGMTLLCFALGWLRLYWQFKRF